MASINPLEFIDENDEEFDWEAAVREIDVACENTKSSASLPTEHFHKFASNSDKRTGFSKQSTLDKFIGTTSLRTENRQAAVDRFTGSSSLRMENQSARDENQYKNEADERASGVKIDPQAAKTWIYPGKIVFAAPSRPLVTQQIKACHEIVGIPQEWTIEMTGQINPLRRADLWKAKRVFFLTPQVLEKDIQSGICLVKQLVCLVIDEAHRASGNYAYCVAVREYGLVHISAGDLLRTEVAAGTENGKKAKEYMEKGQLVPNEIVVMMVKDRLSQADSEEKGWLLDGYPRSSSQATALGGYGFRPDLFTLLEVPEEDHVERVVGRRLDPVTGKIYHLKYSPPETEEIAARLAQRFDDTEEKVKLRLQTHHQNVESVLSLYEDITIKVNGGVVKEEVFSQIDAALTKLLHQKSSFESVAA